MIRENSTMYVAHTEKERERIIRDYGRRRRWTVSVSAGIASLTILKFRGSTKYFNMMKVPSFIHLNTFNCAAPPFIVLHGAF